MISFIINYWIEILFSLIVTVLSHLYRKISKYIKRIKTLEKESCLNLKIHIIQKYEAIKKREYITMDEKEEIIELYDLYKNLECSSIVDEIMKEISNMNLK